MYNAQEIVEKLRKGIEVEAITEYLYRKYHLLIKEQARKQGIPPDDAKDLVQDVMVIFLRKILSGKFTPHNESSLGSYLRKIAQNISYKTHRGDSRRGKREDEYQKLGVNPSTPEDIMIETDYAEHGWETFRRLCQECQQVLTAYYRDELSLAEIAEKYNLGTAEAVKVRKFRCMKELKKLLEL